MVEMKIVPTIEIKEDFNQYINGFISKNNNIALLLDFDGTLAPITTHPKKAAMSNEMQNILDRLTNLKKFFVSIISGRGLNDIKTRVNNPKITYAGNHGIEIESPDGSRNDFQLPINMQENYIKILQKISDTLVKHGAWVEDKKVTLTYHYRAVPEEQITNALREKAIHIIESYGFTANQAHYAIEARPPINWNKGEAALLILRKNFGENWQENVKVIFAGDDTTDEDAMKALKGKSITFRISSNKDIKTYADYILPSTNHVELLLSWLEHHCS